MAGDATSGKMQHLLERAKWDTVTAMAAVPVLGIAASTRVALAAGTRSGPMPC